MVVLRSSAPTNSYDVKSRKKAMIWSELTTGFGFIVTILFWTVLAPQIYPNLGHTKYDNFIKVYYFVIHVFPFLFTNINLIITKCYILENDWWMCSLLWFVYCIVNCVACITYGVPLYPGWDWNTDFARSAFFSLASSSFMGLIYYIYALIFNHFAKK
jgi:hypothetical protein